MTLVLPFVGELHPADLRLMRLAEFMGIATRIVPAKDLFADLSGQDTHKSDSLIVNPHVVSRWLDGKTSIRDFAQNLQHRFPRMLVHCLSSDPLHNALVMCLTAGEVQVSERQSAGSETLSFFRDAREICGAFAGLSIPAMTGSDTCALRNVGRATCQRLITSGEDTLFAIATVEPAEILLLGTGDVLDLDSEAGDGWLGEAVAKLVPHAMALRYLAGSDCWRPIANCANVIIDDPLLRPQYGFLNFDRLLRLMDQHNFAVTIAFIPHNFSRSSQRTVAMFQKHAYRLSVCFHGNDHTRGEFASTDAAKLNTMLHNARSRMAAHEQRSGLRCDPIMVFPQGKFSLEAMAALRSHNFVAAINTGASPQGEQSSLNFRELAQPAVVRYGGFPLFLRRYSADTHDADIAFRLFFGIPIFIVEHHDIFADPVKLLDAVDRVNRLAPDIRWCSASDAVMRSVLQKQGSGSQVQLKAFARTVCVENRSSAPGIISIEWNVPNAAAHLQGAYSDHEAPIEYVASQSSIRVSTSLDRASRHRFSIRDVPSAPGICRPGVRHSLKVLVRRRLSELRDNYICKSPALLAAAKSIQRSLQR